MKKTLNTVVMNVLNQGGWVTLQDLFNAVRAQLPDARYESARATLHQLRAACHPIERRFVRMGYQYPIYAYRLKPR